MANVHSPQPRKIKTLRALTSDGETARVARARATHTEQGARATPEYGPEPSGSASNRLVRAQREVSSVNALRSTQLHLISQVSASLESCQFSLFHTVPTLYSMRDSTSPPQNPASHTALQRAMMGAKQFAPAEVNAHTHLKAAIGRHNASDYHARNHHASNYHTSNCTLAGTRWAFALSCTRGSGTSVYDYASAMEDGIGGGQVALILCDHYPDPSYNATWNRFVNRLGRGRVVEVGSLGRLPGGPKSSSHSTTLHIGQLLKEKHITHVYYQTHGGKYIQFLRPWQLTNATKCIHAVFDARVPWGEHFVKVSTSIRGRVPILPHIVSPVPLPTDDLRASLNIPAASTVFCSYGGERSFNLEFVQQTVCDMAADGNTRRPDVDVVFLFANHLRFCNRSTHLASRLHFLPSLSDEESKGAFLKTCDAMLHARSEGETFGLAVAEFSMSNRPIFTYRGCRRGGHISTLGSRAQLYDNATSLREMLLAFNRTEAVTGHWNAYTAFSRERVMEAFCRNCGGRVGM